jgi:cellulose biosynthesis protein BcsE
MNDVTCGGFSRAGKEPAGWLAGLRASLRRLPRARPGERVAIDGLPEKWSALARGAVHAIYTAAGSRACDALIWNTAREAGLANVTVVRALPREDAAAQLRALGFADGERAQGWPRHFNVLTMAVEGMQADESDVLGVSGGTRSTGTLGMPDASDDASSVSGISGTPAATGASSAPDASSLSTIQSASPAPEPSAARVRAALRALAKRGLRSHSLCVVEGAERWFSWNDPAGLRREGDLLARWCAKRRVSLILIFRTEPIIRGEAPRAHVPPAHAYESSGALHVRFAGVARMGEVAGELRWHVDFWRTGHTLIANETCALRLSASGALAAQLEPPCHGRIPSKYLADDEQRTVVVSSLAVGEAWLPGDWELQPDNAAVFAACADARAATVVFALDGGTPLADLKIAVAQRGETIGLHYELLLLRVGADRILGRDLPISGLLSALRSLQGHVHTRAIVDDTAAALVAAQPDRAGGYAPLPAFCERVGAALQRGALLALPHVLVELTLRADVSHLDALCATLSRQPGRLATVDATHLYLFLFACEPPDAQDRLAQVFTPSAARLFDDRKLYAGSRIAAQLELMRERARHTRSPDYSDVLPVAASSSAGAPPGVTDVGVGMRWVPVGGAVVDARQVGARCPAERCPLPVRREESA